MLVHHRDLLHVLKVGGVLGAVVRVHNGLDGELHVLRRQGLAVMPLHALRQVEGVGAGVLVEGPALRQAGDDAVAAVVGGEAVEEENVDLAVLVHGRIDAGIVAAGIDQGGRFAAVRTGRVSRIYSAGTGRLVSAAGCQAQQHGRRQKQA